MKHEKDIEYHISAYLLGELSTEENTVVEERMQNDPVFKNLVYEVEEALEQMAFDNAIPPPESVRLSLFDERDEEEYSGPGIVRSISYRRYLSFAAAIAVLFGLASIWLVVRWDNAQGELDAMSTQITEQQNAIDKLESELEQSRLQYQELNSIDVTPVLLKGNDKLPGARAIAYVNHSTQKVWLNPQGLPKLDDEHTYQMWADVEGEMINMGVIEKEGDLLAMTYIDDAESLNITIEPAGGSDHPTVENLVANTYL